MLLHICRRGFKKSPKSTAFAGVGSPATITTRTGEASREKKEKARVTFRKLGGQGLGGKRLHHHAVSHFIPKYIRSDTKDMPQDPISTFHFPRHHREDLVNTSTESDSSGNRTDRGGVNFFLFFFCGGGKGKVYNWHERGVL